MAEYPQYTPGVAHDFELYSHNPDQHLDFHHSQSFAPSSTYAMDPAFSAQYDPMAPLSHVSRHPDLQFHYDGIAQGVKPFQYQTPAGSPHSTSHSFHEIPPVLSASSESGASVSSSAMGSPSILPPFNDSWNSFSMATTSGYDYPGMVAHEKSYVGKSIVSSIAVSYSPSATSPTSRIVQNHTFRPTQPTRPSSCQFFFRHIITAAHSIILVAQLPMQNY